MAQRAPRRVRRPRNATGNVPGGATIAVIPQDARKRQGLYSPSDVALLWIRNGGPVKYAKAMGVVSHFENSTGDPKSVNSIGATGLFQIYNGPNTNVKALQNPNTNARAAVKKFKAAKRAGGTGFEPWVSSKGGWGQYVDERTGKVDDDALRASGISFPKTLGEKLATSDLGDALAAVAKPLEPLAAIGELAVGLTELLLTPEGWRRILKVTIGGVILIWALNQLSKSMFGVNPVGKTARAAGTLTGAGAVSKAVAKKTAAATGGKVAGKVAGQ